MIPLAVLGGYFGKNSLMGLDLLKGVSLGIVISQVLWIPVAGYLVYVATHKPSVVTETPTTAE